MPYFRVVSNAFSKSKKYRNGMFFVNKGISNERKSEQAHIPHAPTLLENDVHNE